MRKPLIRLLPFFAIAILLAFAANDWATCGGGGGGGMGGSTAPELTYPVPWHVQAPQDPPATGGLVVYWFPASAEELKQSSLRMSRTLSLYASQCVAMDVADVRSPAGVKFAADAKLPVVVLTTADGNVVGKAENNNGYLRVGQVEKLVDDEMKQRQNAVEEKFKSAKDRAKSGDKDAAIPLYRAVLEQKCLFPKKAKDAAKELKKLGVNDVGEILDMPDFASPSFDARVSARMVRTLRSGIDAEMRGDYPASEKFYAEAHRLDPGDPTPLRYLGELYRHETGEWDKARTMFDAILAMPSDPIARAVALHGLGKITIHEGDFAKGRELMESSVKVYPLALAYRNLAVYWNSEGDSAKTAEYVQKALALEPADPFNLTFAAAFMAGNGHAEEALKIAAENQSLLPASYNLAAIYAQTGQREKALALLKRHFFEYERYDAVRSKEMMEARVDAVFLSLRDDPVFVALTSGADGKLDPSGPMPARAGGAN
jgi:tetratricopeptide (TPR) repeat protein